MTIDSKTTIEHMITAGIQAHEYTIHNAASKGALYPAPAQYAVSKDNRDGDPTLAGKPDPSILQLVCRLRVWDNHVRARSGSLFNRPDGGLDGCALL